MMEGCRTEKYPPTVIEVIPRRPEYMMYGGHKWVYDQRRGFYRLEQTQNGEKIYYLHRQIWEDFYGESPGSTPIYHADGNNKNNIITNLVISDSVRGKQITREIRRRKKDQPAKHPQKCKVCSTEFLSRYSSKKFCSMRCSNIYYRAYK